MRAPMISLVAYADRDPRFVFVLDPSLRGRYLRTDPSVAVACPSCEARAGEPCFTLRDGVNRYQSTTHVARRSKAQHESAAHPGDIVGDPEPSPLEWPALNVEVEAGK